MNQLDFNDS